MLRRLFTPMTMTLLSGGLLFPPLRATESNTTISTVAAQPSGASVYTEDLHPFSHFAAIPAGADLSTIRFQKARLVQVPSRMKLTTFAGYCAELAFRDPGGSINCPQTQTDAPVSAYEVTYSYTGLPLTSDEYGGQNFTFSVYLQPNELATEVREALKRKLSRSGAAGYFAVSHYQEKTKRVVIDDKQSHFCEGNYMDGQWTHTEAGCKDSIVYTTVTAPSGYITVRVDPASFLK